MGGDCKAALDNEFGFVRFLEPPGPARVLTASWSHYPMFVFNRSLFAVLAPLALLAAVAFFSNYSAAQTRAAGAELTETRDGPVPARTQAVAANFPSR
jgi:hypothetical protein